ncbi:MAG: MBL fold metallo-hydrolase [Bauldia sp.]
MANGRLKFTILGCGASPGVPRIDGDWGACDPSEPKNRRTRCSLLIERWQQGGERPTRLLVDTPPDIREQLTGLGRIAALDGVVYTHAHADHVHGIDDLRGFWHGNGKLVDVYSDDATQARLDQAFGYCFSAPPGSFYPPIVKRHRIAAYEPFAVDGPGGRIAVRPFRQAHGDISSLGLRVGGLAYSCDVSALPDQSLAYLDGLDVWIVDALRRRPHPSHFTVEQAVAWAQRLAPRRTILTHMHAEIDFSDLTRTLPAGIEPGFDGLTVELPDG